MMGTILNICPIPCCSCWAGGSSEFSCMVESGWAFSTTGSAGRLSLVCWEGEAERPRESERPPPPPRGSKLLFLWPTFSSRPPLPLAAGDRLPLGDRLLRRLRQKTGLVTHSSFLLVSSIHLSSMFFINPDGIEKAKSLIYLLVGRITFSLFYPNKRRPDWDFDPIESSWSKLWSNWNTNFTKISNHRK